jgi:hypothetical protein
VHVANAYAIRLATVDDVGALRRLVALDSPRALFCGPALIGEIDGVPAAAVSLADGRVIADPSQPTAILRERLEMRYRALQPQAHRPGTQRRRRHPGATITSSAPAERMLRPDPASRPLLARADDA